MTLRDRLQIVEDTFKLDAMSHITMSHGEKVICHRLTFVIAMLTVICDELDIEPNLEGGSL